MTPGYTPQPGTIAARAVDVVTALAAGETIANVVLAERLGQSSAVVIAGMEAPLRYGLVERVTNGRLVSWRRGDGTAKGAPPEPDDEPPVQRIVKARQGGVSLIEVPRWPGVDLSAPAPTPLPLPIISPGKPPRGMRVALWSDGQLQVQRGPADVILFTPEETRHLVHYLERMAEASE